MANYNVVSRTNYFEVKDRDAFIEELNKLSFEDMDVLETDNSPNKIALGGYSDVSVAYDEESDDWVEIYELVQKHIVEDDACIFVISGYEKLRYVTAYALVVTKNDIKNVDARDLAIAEAAKMLGVEEFSTQLDY